MKRIFALILALVMVLGLAACGGDKPTTSTPGTSTPAASTPGTTPGTPSDPAKPSEPAVDPDADKYGGELVMCSNNATSTMDPHDGIGSLGNSRWMIHIWESLAVAGLDGNVYSEVCDFEQSADGLTLKFTLRECYFSNGEKVTMDDVWASIQRIAGHSTTSGWDKLWKGTSIQKDDKITISINKDEGSRTAAMLAGEYDLAMVSTSMMETAESLGLQKVDDNPVLHSTFVTGTQGWWSSDARAAAIDKMKTNPTGSAASVEGYEEWCQAVVDECPFILFGHLINYNFLKPDLVWDVQGSREYYWNVYRQ